MDGHELISVEEYERRRQLAVANARRTGVACPDCGGEFMREDNAMLMSHPPQMRVRCEKCHRPRALSL